MWNIEKEKVGRGKVAAWMRFGSWLLFECMVKFSDP